MSAAAAMVLPLAHTPGAGAREHAACRQDHPRACLRIAARHYHVSAPLLLRISFCESRWRPDARNRSGSSGLLQFLPTTWAGTPYARRSVWRSKWNALAGAWLLARAGTSPWLQSRRCWAR